MVIFKSYQYLMVILFKKKVRNILKIPKYVICYKDSGLFAHHIIFQQNINYDRICAHVQHLC